MIYSEADYPSLRNEEMASLLDQEVVFINTRDTHLSELCDYIWKRLYKAYPTFNHEKFASAVKLSHYLVRQAYESDGKVYAPFTEEAVSKAFYRILDTAGIVGADYEKGQRLRLAAMLEEPDLISYIEKLAAIWRLAVRLVSPP